MKCIIYSRVSTADQTTENQILQLREYAAKQGWEIFAVKTDICSGCKSADERSGLREVFDLARRRRFDVLLFWSLDRLSREEPGRRWNISPAWTVTRSNGTPTAKNTSPHWESSPTLLSLSWHV